MATVKQPVGLRTPLDIPGIATLGNAQYAASAPKDNSTTQPLDVLVELSVTPGSVSGNKQAVLFALACLDGLGANYQTGTNATDEAVMTLIGALPLPSSGVKQTKIFSVAASYGGSLPPFLKFVVKNDSGATFTAGSIFTSEVSATVS